MTVALGLQSPRPLLARGLPFALYIAFLALTPWLAEVLPGIDRRWLYAVQIGAVLGALVAFHRDYGELRGAPPCGWPGVAWALVLGVAVFVLWINLDSGWAVLGPAKAGFVPLAADGSLDWPLVAVRIFGAAAVVPVMEELFWRSCVQRWIDRPDFLAQAPGDGSRQAWFLASLVFGLEHGQWFAGILAGLGYGWLYRRFGNLWLAILAHGVTNLLLGVWVVASGQWEFW